MAITFINYTDSGVVSLTASAVKPTGVTTGDKMIAFSGCTNHSGATLTGPASGWTQVGTTQSDLTAGTTFAVYYKDDDGTAGPYTFTVGTGNITVVIVAYRGAATGAVDQSNPQKSNASSASNSGVTPSAAGETLIDAVFCGFYTVTAGSSGYTVRLNTATSLRWFVQDMIGASSGASGTVSVPLSGTGTSDTWMLALAPTILPMRQRMVL